MPDKIRTFTVILDKEYTVDDLRKTIGAISQVKRVALMIPSDANIAPYLETKKIRTFMVVLDAEYTAEDLQKTIGAVSQIKRVALIIPSDADVAPYLETKEPTDA